MKNTNIFLNEKINLKFKKKFKYPVFIFAKKNQTSLSF